jgi:hypothetical protein
MRAGAWRDWRAAAWAAMVGSLLAGYVFWLEWGPCSAVLQLFDTPFNSLLGIPRPEAPVPPGYYVLDGGGCMRDSFPPLGRVWIVLWLPMLLAQWGAGYLAAHWAASISLARCAIAGSLPTLVVFLPTFIDVLDEPEARPLMGVAVIVGASLVGAALGYAAGRLARKVAEDRPARTFGEINQFRE